MKDQASVSQCIDETASLVARAGQNVNNSISRVDIIRYRVLPTSSSDSKTVALLSSNIRAASQLINDLYTPCEQIVYNLLITSTLLPKNVLML